MHHFTLTHADFIEPVISNLATFSIPTPNPALTPSFIAISSIHTPSLNPIPIPSSSPTVSPTDTAIKANSMATCISSATVPSSIPNLIAILTPNSTAVNTAATSTTTNTTAVAVDVPINAVVIVTTAAGEAPPLVCANEDKILADQNDSVTTSAASMSNTASTIIKLPTTFRKTLESEPEDILSRREVVAISSDESKGTHMADNPQNMQSFRSLNISSSVSTEAPEEIQYGDGNVKLIYEQYNEMFPMVEGSINQKIIDDLYCLSFMMPDCKVRLSVHNPIQIRELECSGCKNLYVPEKPEGTYQTLQAESTYYIYVEQKEEQLRLDQEKMRKVAAGMHGATIRLDFGNRLNEETREESCSCVHGNPCVNEYGCNDWNNRAAVSLKNGWKGF